MTINDPIGDLLTRIRNAQNAHKNSFRCKTSKFKNNVLDILKEEGYIRGYKIINTLNNGTVIEIDLKYYQGKPVIKKLKRISKPGCRVYSSIKDLPKVYQGLGIYILSTPKGVLSDKQARIVGVGGEVLCKIF